MKVPFALGFAAFAWGCASQQPPALPDPWLDADLLAQTWPLQVADATQIEPFVRGHGWVALTHTFVLRDAVFALGRRRGAAGARAHLAMASMYDAAVLAHTARPPGAHTATRHAVHGLAADVTLPEVRPGGAPKPPSEEARVWLALRDWHLEAATMCDADAGRWHVVPELAHNDATLPETLPIEGLFGSDDLSALARGYALRADAAIADGGAPTSVLQAMMTRMWDGSAIDVRGVLEASVAVEQTLLDEAAANAGGVRRGDHRWAATRARWGLVRRAAMLAARWGDDQGAAALQIAARTSDDHRRADATLQLLRLAEARTRGDATLAEVLMAELVRDDARWESL